MKKFNFWAGIVLILVGLFLFLKNVVINSFRFYRIGGFVNTGAILMILLIIAFVAMIVKFNKITLGLFVTCLIFLIFTIILSIDIRLRPMTAFDFILIAGTLFGGVGLTLKSLIGSKK